MSILGNINFIVCGNLNLCNDAGKSNRPPEAFNNKFLVIDLKCSAITQGRQDDLVCFPSRFDNESFQGKDIFFLTTT